MAKKLTNQPDKHMEWIYDAKFKDDEQAKDLRNRRNAALIQCQKQGFFVEMEQARNKL